MCCVSRWYLWWVGFPAQRTDWCSSFRSTSCLACLYDASILCASCYRSQVTLHSWLYWSCFHPSRSTQERDCSLRLHSYSELRMAYSSLLCFGLARQGSHQWGLGSLCFLSLLRAGACCGYLWPWRIFHRLWYVLSRSTSLEQSRHRRLDHDYFVNLPECSSCLNLFQVS